MWFFLEAEAATDAEVYVEHVLYDDVEKHKVCKGFHPILEFPIFNSVYYSHCLSSPIYYLC